MLRNQRVYLRPEGLSCQWFLVKTTESTPCLSASNNPATDVPAKLASGLCFLISAHTWPLPFLLRGIYNYSPNKEIGH